MTARCEAEPGFDWPRYPRVLVALDETPAADFALGHAVPYALDRRSQLTLLAVVPNLRFLLGAAGVSPEVMVEQMEKAAAERLRKIAAINLFREEVAGHQSKIRSAATELRKLNAAPPSLPSRTSEACFTHSQARTPGAVSATRASTSSTAPSPRGRS
jgi:hypothetical protein